MTNEPRTDEPGKTGSLNPQSDSGQIDSKPNSSLPFFVFNIGEKPGDQIGPYRLLSVLGEGGYGIVFLAERQEPHVQRVALKLIKPGMDTRAVIARFEQERQALAVMDHPNVAKVYDAGATPLGRPYFVMEYVLGEPITAYCDRHNLTIPQRLELFASVCAAVQHAHHKGLIHRDITPNNVMVTIKDERPVAKVIDFGVAKAISRTLTDKTIFTERGQIIGTPEYMSPEQAEMGSLDVDTRTDVYSLGVVLYELLAGALPFESHSLRSKAYGEIQRIIRHVEPPTPSAKFSSLGTRGREVAQRRHMHAEGLAKQLKNELEWIPLRAMRKDRTERYQTAHELRADVLNYLEGQPLTAGPATWAYRVRKSLAGKRWTVCAIASIWCAIFLIQWILLVTSVIRTRNAITAADAWGDIKYAIGGMVGASLSGLSESDSNSMRERGFQLGTTALRSLGKTAREKASITPAVSFVFDEFVALDGCTDQDLRFCLQTGGLENGDRLWSDWSPKGPTEISLDDLFDRITQIIEMRAVLLSSGNSYAFGSIGGIQDRRYRDRPSSKALLASQGIRLEPRSWKLRDIEWAVDAQSRLDTQAFPLSGWDARSINRWKPIALCFLTAAVSLIWWLSPLKRWLRATEVLLIPATYLICFLGAFWWGLDVRGLTTWLIWTGAVFVLFVPAMTLAINECWKALKLSALAHGMKVVAVHRTPSSRRFAFVSA